LRIGAASMPARSATIEDKPAVVEKMPTKGKAPSPLRVQNHISSFALTQTAS
jgi:hypothetical protein